MVRTPPIRGRRLGSLLALVAVLTVAGCSSADPGPTTGTPATRAPGTTPQSSTTPDPTPEPTATADQDATVGWDPPTVAGYEESAVQPMDGITQLESSTCIFQLVHEVITDAGLDDSEYTDVALDNATRVMGSTTETGRRDGTIPTEAGPMEAREVTLVLEAGGTTVDMRMLMRASGQDEVLVALTYVCPAGELDEAEWADLVTGTTLLGTTATTF